MTGPNNNKRPVLRNTETRAELDGGNPSVQRPAIASSKRDDKSAGGIGAASAARPAVAKQSEKSPDKAESVASTTSKDASAAGVTDADFATIKGFIDSLGDPQTGLDIDGDATGTARQVASQSTEQDHTTDVRQDQQNAASTPTMKTSAVSTVGNDRDRLGLEQDLASIRLEDTDYRRIGHRNNDDKPLATIIKGGIAL